MSFDVLGVSVFIEAFIFVFILIVGVQGLFFFFASVSLAQIFLVLKKKQFEKVQLSEMNF